MFSRVTITPYSNIKFMVAAKGIAPFSRSPNECNPYWAFVTMVENVGFAPTLGQRLG